MVTKERRQREFQKRERMFLQATRRLLLERGYGALTMDQVAEALEYSRGTVYLHFRSKGDLISALVLEAMEVVDGLLEKIDAFDAPSRDKAVAWSVIPEILRRLYPDYVTTQRILETQTTGERASEERIDRIRKAHRAIQDHLLGIVHLAVEEESLMMKGPMEPYDLLFGLVALSWGTMALRSDRAVLVGLEELLRPKGAPTRNFDALLDGYGWRPLSTERDYDSLRRHIWRRGFREEMDAIEKLHGKNPSSSTGGGE